MDAPPDYSHTEYWDHLVQRDPAEALDIVNGLLDTLVGDERALALRAASRCLLDLGRLDEAAMAAGQALEAAEQCADDASRHSVLMTASVILAEAGDFERALSTLEELAADSSGAMLGRVRVQMACVLAPIGRLNDALAQLDLSEQLVNRHGDVGDRFRVYFNRGWVLLEQGRLSQADADFELAAELAHELGMTAALAQTHANRGVLHGRARRLRESVHHFERAAELFGRCGNPGRAVGGMEIDRAEVYLHSGLVADALSSAKRAVAFVEPTGNRMLAGDARMMLARAELAAGRLRDAERTAIAAGEILQSAHRDDMTLHAMALAAQATLARVEDPVEGAALLAATRAPAAELRSSGWHQQAQELTVARVRCALRLGLAGDVAADLDDLRLGVWSDQRDHVLVGWFAEAVARMLAGERGAALDACRDGLDQLDGIVAEAGSLAQRSAAMRLGSDLSQLTIALAVEAEDADTVLAAAEGTRARALHDELAGRERHQPLTTEGAQRLRSELAARLGDRVLVEWVVAGDRVWAVLFDRDGSRLVDVGARRDVVRARDRVVVWLDLAAAEPDASSARATLAAGALDELLLAPLELPAGTGLVVVPVDLLHGIPWSGLPTCSGRQVALSPSAQLWLDADRRAGRATRSVGVVIGPDVESATLERDAVERVHAAVDVASGPGATAATVRSMFAAHDVVHVAAHGTFRSDHPLLSTLGLADGPATLYEAVPERVHSRLVVLSSCEAGAQKSAEGAEVLGLSAVMLARGAASVLAPLTVVRDLECAEFLADVHAELGRGAAIGDAVGAVRDRWLGDDDLSRWAVASSFLCFGSGATSF